MKPPPRNRTRSRFKIQILGDLSTALEGVDDPNWAAFVRHYTISLPLAYLAQGAYVLTTRKGSKLLDVLWDDLLFLLDIKEDTAFKTLPEVFRASPHEWITIEVSEGVNEPKLPHILPLSSFWEQEGMVIEEVALTEDSYLNWDLDSLLGPLDTLPDEEEVEASKDE